jgi:acetyl-CoA C-acetyltransferase/acetyl-CoA acyltransferase
MVAWNSLHNGGAAITSAVRTPFTRMGTALAKTPITELARTVFQESVYRAGWPADRIDEVVLGNVVMPADATNPARVAGLQAGTPNRVPALTVQRNCASGMESISEAATRIQRHEARAVLAGGAESMSTIPLLFPDETLEPVGQLMKAKSLRRRMAAMTSFRPRHFKPRAALELGLTDPTCGT